MTTRRRTLATSDRRSAAGRHHGDHQDRDGILSTTNVIWLVTLLCLLLATGLVTAGLTTGHAAGLLIRGTELAVFSVEVPPLSTRELTGPNSSSPADDNEPPESTGIPDAGAAGTILTTPDCAGERAGVGASGTSGCSERFDHAETAAPPEGLSPL